ncbi:IclR family transcriptional regulator [Edaphovirga cremea]|uniref:IclR family transcriptional regulator n=1 Tax=Edaphovirga cremea TaxID=2267246 RepID=UPI000DEF8D9F|nr:IclR family transcriptional regulator [Edaphovirga cremea]
MPKNAEIDTSGNNAPALRRAVQILDAVSELPHPPTFTEIVTKLGLPKSSAHGLCAALVDLGMLVRTDAGTYRVGAHVMNWANAFLGQTDLVEEFQRLLQDRRELSDFSVTLTVLDGQQVVYVACSNSKAALGFTFRIGMRLPAPFTATGKAILSTLDDEDICHRFAAGWPQPLTVHSVASIEMLLQELALARQRGYSVDDGQIREGMFCIGAPVHDFSGQVVAGLAVSMLEQEATESNVDTIGSKLVDIAASLSARLGNRRG